MNGWMGWVRKNGETNGTKHLVKDGRSSLCGIEPPDGPWMWIAYDDAPPCRRCERVLILRLLPQEAAAQGFLLRAMPGSSKLHAVKPAPGIQVQPSLCGYIPSAWRPVHSEQVCSRCRCIVLGLPLRKLKRARGSIPGNPVLF